MAVRIRLLRRGRKKLALYDIVVADARAPRDGRFIEKLGNYNPNTDPATVVLDTDRAFQWVMDGAQPSDTVRTLLSRKGVMLRKHLQVGVNKGAITQEDADKRFEAWLKDKENKEQVKIDGIAKEEAATAKARLDAETKVKEARAEALAKKQSEMLAAEQATAEAEAAEESTEEVTETVDETPAAEAPVEEAAEETPAEEAKAEETPAEEAPVEEPKAEETPAEEAPVEEPKAEEKPAKGAPAEEPKAEDAATEEEAAPEVKAEEVAPEANEASEAAEEPVAEEKAAKEEAEEKKEE